MTGIATHRFPMLIQMMVEHTVTDVRRIRMAVLTARYPLYRGHRGTAPRNAMLARSMAFSTGKIQITHVHIAARVGVFKVTPHIRMLDRITPAATEVALATALAPAMPYLLRHMLQIHLRSRVPGSGRLFGIGSRGVMAYETIHMRGVFKIKTIVFPTVSCVTACATRLVADDAHSVVIERGRALSMVHRARMIRGVL